MAPFTANNMTSVTFKPNMPLFIPRVFPEHADEQYIVGTFHVLGLGQVAKVDLVERSVADKVHFEAFVHFATWYNTPVAHQLQQQILDDAVTAKVVHCQREIKPGCLRPAFWIVNECLNPETEREREMKQTIQQLRDEAEWAEESAAEQLTAQEKLITRLFDLVDHQAAELVALRGLGEAHDVVGIVPEEENFINGIPLDEFDLHRELPETQDELPVVGQELAQGLPDGPLRDFYTEVGEGLPSEWLALSDDEKRAQLDAQLDELQATVSDCASCASSQSYTVGWEGYNNVDEARAAFEECPGCESGVDCDGAHRNEDGDYHPGCYCMDTMNPYDERAEFESVVYGRR